MCSWQIEVAARMPMVIAIKLEHARMHEVF
jgi:hypothetical protein